MAQFSDLEGKTLIKVEREGDKQAPNGLFSWWEDKYDQKSSKA